MKRIDDFRSPTSIEDWRKELRYNRKGMKKSKGKSAAVDDASGAQL